MSTFDLWKLPTEYSVVHAALLMSGNSPEAALLYSEHDLIRKCKDYLPAKLALCSAIKSDELRAIHIVYADGDLNSGRDLCIHKTILSVKDLYEFTMARGHYFDIFDRHPPVLKGPGPGNEYLSLKLEAANKAWSAVTSDLSKLRGKSPKQALEDWLTENAADLGLLNKVGTPNRTGIEQIAKVANWKPGGGATPTPSTEAFTLNQHSVMQLPSPEPINAHRVQQEFNSYNSDIIGDEII